MKKIYYDDTFVIQEISPSQLLKKTVSYKKKQNKKQNKNYSSIFSKMPGYKQHIKRLLILHEQALHKANKQLQDSNVKVPQFLSSQHLTPAELVNIYMADEGTEILNEMFKSVSPRMDWTPYRYICSAQLASYKIHSDVITDIHYSPQHIVKTLIEAYRKADRFCTEWARKDVHRLSIPVQSTIMATNSKVKREADQVPKDNYQPYVPDYTDREFVPQKTGRKGVMLSAEEVNQRWKEEYQNKNDDSLLHESVPLIHAQTHKYPAVTSKKKLHIFASFSLISCNTQKHKVVDAAIPLFSIIENHYIDVPVHKCLTCNRIFISEEMWRAYMKHGIDKAYYVQHETQFDQYKKHSELNSYGYTVGKTGLSVVERQVLIINLLKTEKMQPYEIERDIVNAINIHQNNPKMQDAVSDWEDDLKFLGDYILKNIHN